MDVVFDTRSGTTARPLVSCVLVMAVGQAAYLVERTVRSVRQLGLEPIVVGDDSGRAAVLQSGGNSDGLWVLRAGSWVTSPREASALVTPRASATGRALIAIGAVRRSGTESDPGDSSCREASEWQRILQETRGDLEGLYITGPASKGTRLPASMWFDRSLAAILLESWQTRNSLEDALWAILRQPANRTIHWKPFDVCVAERLRVVQVITSLQRGGAERIALNLHRSWLTDPQMTSLLIALAPAARDSYEPPAGCVVMPGKGSRQERVSGCVKLLKSFGADIVHSHLLTLDEMTELGRSGVSHLATVHNAKPGWPIGFESVGKPQVNLIVACSRAVEADLRIVQNSVPVRTIWNGIESLGNRLKPEQRLQYRAEVRAEQGLEDNAIVLISVANIRPQKRLERIPRIMSALQRRLLSSGKTNPVRLLLIGERSSSAVDAEMAERDLRSAIDEEQLEYAVRWVGSVANPERYLSAADLMVSVSDYEGLSLAHLEAISMGLPIVAYSAGGTDEIGSEDAGLHTLPVGADFELFAETVVRVLRDIESWTVHGRSPTEGSRLRYDFTLKCMSERYRHFYQILVQRRKKSVLLVINNLSVGGAQSSAARLLQGLHQQGLSVRAAVLQEDADNPTPGRQRLTAAGIPVQVLPKAGTVEPQAAVLQLFTEAGIPEVILLWNVLPSYKVLIADLAIESRIFDVSPGEMNFDSLARYFRQPLSGVPYSSAANYGRRLAGSIVKYSSERQRAEQVLGTAVHVIPNGVPIPVEQVRHSEKSVIVFGTSARINPQKRLEELLTAFRLLLIRVGNCELLIAGGVEPGCDDYYERLQEMSAGLPVRWVGNVDDVNGFLLKLDVFVMISHPAGCPNASLEAMAIGLPMIATDYGGASEQVDETIGELVPDGDVERLAEAMLKMQQSLERRKNCGAAARHRIETRFSMPKMLGRYIQVIWTEDNA